MPWHGHHETPWTATSNCNRKKGRKKLSSVYTVSVASLFTSVRLFLRSILIIETQFLLHHVLKSCFLKVECALVFFAPFLNPCCLDVFQCKDRTGKRCLGGAQCMVNTDKKRKWHLYVYFRNTEVYRKERKKRCCPLSFRAINTVLWPWESGLCLIGCVHV